MRSFVVIIVGLILCSSIYAQEKQVSPTYALSFGIADNFRLDKFIMDIGITKILDDSHQVRLYVSPRISTTNTDGERGVLFGPDQKNSNENRTYSFGVGADYLWVLMKNDDINLYGGAGLVLNYGLDKRTSTSIYTPGTKQESEDKNSSRSGGLRGVLGAEWMVSNKISIHSEYVVAGSYNWQYIESKFWNDGLEYPTAKTTITGVTLGSGVLFGVSIYL